MNAQAMRPNEWPQNERTKAANERTDNIMYERTNKPNKVAWPITFDEWHFDGEKQKRPMEL